MRVIILALVFAVFTIPSFASETIADSTTPSVMNVAYYFYNTVRCASCLKIEKYSHEALEQSFSDKLSNGELTWMMKNLDEDANAHFIDDYKLFTKSLVLVRYENGQQVKWKNCDRVWELLKDEAAFKKYVETEIAAFLGS